jgi:peptide/histidine transporter 3/4
MRPARDHKIMYDMDSAFESIDLSHSVRVQEDAAADSREYKHQGSSLSPFDLSGTLSSLFGLDKKGRVPDPNRLPWRENPMFTRAPFILGQEFCERLAYYGIATNIVTYLTNQMNYTTSQAASYNQIWSGTCYLTPLLGAFLADSYFGRYLVILVFSLIYIVGLVLLAISAGVPSLTPTEGMSPTTVQAFAFWFAMSLIALGTGGIKPNVSTFGADQFNPEDVRHRMQIPRFYNWFYAAINGGAILSALVVVNVQTGVSWWAGFTIPACAFALACVLFVAGSRLYRRVPPGGSPLMRMFRTIRTALQKRRCHVEDEKDLYEVDDVMSVIPGQPKLSHSPGMVWLDKAAVIVEDGAARQQLETIQEDSDEGDSVKCGASPRSVVESPPACVDVEKHAAPSPTALRNLSTVTEVECVKAMVRLLPIAFTLIFYNAIYAQMLSMFVLQGNGMNTRLGSLTLSAATVSVLDSISVIVCVAIYDLVVSPGFKKMGRPISPLVRIGVGYVFAILSMIVAACVEIARLRVAADEGLTDVKPVSSDPSTIPNISVWWQVPQYSLVGISEVFAMIGSMEFFYQQAPDSIRSLSAALQLLTVGIGSYVAAALVAIIQAITTSGGKPGWIADNINEGHMDYFFFTLAVIMAIVLVGYVFIARGFVYRNVDHMSYDVGVIGLAPDKLSCPPSGFNRQLADQIDEGMLSAESLRSGRIFTSEGGSIGARSSLSEYIATLRSRRTGGGLGGKQEVEEERKSIRLV